MESVPYTSTAFITTLVLGGVVMAIASAFLTYQQAKGTHEQSIKPKGIVRDLLLGGIFTAMAWHVAPDTMSSITSSVTERVATTVETATKHSGGSIPEIDLQVGPASF
jgi:hypothetical protein